MTQGLGLDARFGVEFADSRKPLFTNPPKSQYEARPCANDKKPYKEYHDYLAGLIKDWKLMDLIDTPGAAVQQYTMKRRIMADISAIGQLVRITTEKPVKIPLEYDWYPIPTMIFKNQGVGKDWLVEREMGDVLAYAIENTNIHPFDDPKCKGLNKEALTEAIRQRTVVINFSEVSGAAGAGRLELEPGCALALPLCADPYLPRKAMPDNAQHPATRLVPYDPTNLKHNKSLRPDFGIGTDVRTFIEPESEVEDVKAKK